MSMKIADTRLQTILSSQPFHGPLTEGLIELIRKALQHSTPTLSDIIPLVAQVTVHVVDLEPSLGTMPSPAPMETPTHIFYTVRIFEQRKSARWYINKMDSHGVYYFNLATGYNGDQAEGELITAATGMVHISPQEPLLTINLSHIPHPFAVASEAWASLSFPAQPMVVTEATSSVSNNLFDLLGKVPEAVSVGTLRSLLQGKSQFTALEALNVVHMARVIDHLGRRLG